MEFILKSALLIGILYSFYKLFLHKETFFKSIRIYFIIGLIATVVLPIISIPIYIETTVIEAFVPEITENYNNHETTVIDTVTATKAVKKINWMALLTSIYFIGILFFSIKFLIEVISLYRLIYQSDKQKNDKITFAETIKNISPFSIFNYIVYNKNKFTKTELAHIITHEKVHVKHLHTYDMLLVHLLVIMQWFNPFAWLYKKDLQQNLEFLADKYAQENVNTLKEYQYLLLKTSVQKNPFALSTNFYNSLIKKRIIMLQKTPSKKLNQVKYVLLLPLIALFLYAFNTKEIVKPLDETLFSNLATINKNKLIIIDVSHGGKDLGAVVENISEKNIVLKIAKKIKKQYKGKVNIKFTRFTDDYILLSDRINFINKLKPDYIISLHVNNHKDNIKNGVIAYVSDENPATEKSKQIANQLLTNISNKNLKIKGISKGNLKIISKVNSPAILLELGYLSNLKDRNYINSDKGQTEIASSIVDFINGNVISFKKQNFIYPIAKKNLTKMASGYGMRMHPTLKYKKMHNGTDFIAKLGTTVMASLKGEVIIAKFGVNKGYYVEIKHANNFKTRYFHLKSYQVKVGDKIETGQKIGEVGNSGKLTGAHLHFEILKDDKHVDPMLYLSTLKNKFKNDKDRTNSKLSVMKSVLIIKDNKIIINSKTTDKELKNIQQKFEKNHKVTLKIFDVKRNSNSEIIAIKIEGKSKESTSSFSYSQNEAIPNITIEYKKNGDLIFFKSNGFKTRENRKVEVSFKEDNNKDNSFSFSTGHHSNKKNDNNNLFLKGKRIMGLRINPNTTNNKIDKLVKDFENKFKVNLKVYDIKRNNENQIIALKINANSKNTTNNFNFNDENSFYSITATYLKDKDQFYIRSWSSDAKKYIVKAKDTYYSIAKKYRISVDKLQELNSGVSLKVGNRLIVKRDFRFNNNVSSSYANATRVVKILDEDSNIKDRIIFEGDDSENITYIINGKKTTKNELSKIDKDDINAIKIENKTVYISTKKNNYYSPKLNTNSNLGNTIKTPKTKKMAILDVKVLNRHKAKFYYNDKEITYKEALKLVKRKFNTLEIKEDWSLETIHFKDK